MTAGIVWYAYQKADFLTALVFCLWPLGALVWCFFNIPVSNRSLFQIIAELGAGGILAAAPVLIYHLMHGSLSAWYGDTVTAAVSLSGMKFIDASAYSRSAGFCNFANSAARDCSGTG